MASLECPNKHPNDTRRFISVSVIRKVAERHSTTVDARICPTCGVIFADPDEVKRLWAVYGR
jgi:hypothetical protein